MVIVKTAVPGVSEQALARFTQRARKSAGLRGEVNVVLTSTREARAFNRRFRGKDAPTDVLSFPPAQPSIRKHRVPTDHWPLTTDHYSGDIVICTPIAARNARRFGHSAAQELKILILHGLLHLAGYDHEHDSGRMARREEKLRRDLGLSNGLIRRSEAPTANDRRPTTKGRRGQRPARSRR